MNRKSLIGLTLLALACVPAPAAAQMQTATYEMDQSGISVGSPPFAFVQVQTDTSGSGTATLTYTINTSNPNLTNAFWIGIGFNLANTPSGFNASDITTKFQPGGTTETASIANINFGSMGHSFSGFRVNSLTAPPATSTVVVTISNLGSFATLANFETTDGNSVFFAGHVKGAGSGGGLTGDLGGSKKLSVPEPSSLLLASASGGIALAGWVRCRRRRRHEHDRQRRQGQVQ